MTIPSAKLAAPLHVASLNGRRVRFFKTPLNDGRPDFPWHSVTDLMDALKLPADLCQSFTRQMKRDWPDVHHTIATAEGLVNVAPHFAAQGLIHATAAVGRATEDFETAYCLAIAEAGKQLVGDLQGEAFLSYMLAGYARWDGATADKPGA